jgi:hypothetical protein
VEGLQPKHAIKQVDRLLSNEAFDVNDIFRLWVPYLVAQRREISVAMDWTDFDADDHSTLMISLITSHSRPTPLVWTTVEKSTLKGWRRIHEETLLQLLAEVVPAGVQVTVLADRGFGDVGLYALCETLGFFYIIRFKGNIFVEDSEGTSLPAADRVPSNGRPLKLCNVKVTQQQKHVPAVVLVKAAKMKEAWCLATNLAMQSASSIVHAYGRRFTIEERFRDSKDPRFGLGLSATHVGTKERRDRLLLLDAFAGSLLVLLGAAGESIGLDRWMKSNTVKRRTHSLFNQGLYYFQSLATMKQELFEPLMISFAALVREHQVFVHAFGLI